MTRIYDILALEHQTQVLLARWIGKFSNNAEQRREFLHANHRIGRIVRSIGTNGSGRNLTESRRRKSIMTAGQPQVVNALNVFIPTALVGGNVCIQRLRGACDVYYMMPVFFLILDTLLADVDICEILILNLTTDSNHL